MKQTTTITVAQGHHGFKEGDLISITLPDTRWWRRFLFWVFRRGTPWRTTKRRVSFVGNETTLEMEEPNANRK